MCQSVVAGRRLSSVQGQLLAVLPGPAAQLVVEGVRLLDHLRGRGAVAPSQGNATSPKPGPPALARPGQLQVCTQ